MTRLWRTSKTRLCHTRGQREEPPGYRRMRRASPLPAFYCLVSLLLLASVCTRAYAHTNAPGETSGGERLSEETLSEATLSEITLEKKSPCIDDIWPIVTSRPSVTDAATTVPLGSLQVESGTTHTWLAGNQRTWTLPETSARLGVGKNTELRFSAPLLTSRRDEGLDVSSQQFGDLAVGFAQHWKTPGNVDVALIPMLSIPSGANSFSSQGLDPDIRLTAAKAVSSKLILSSQLGARINTHASAAADVLITPTAIAYYQVTPALCSFWEVAAFIPPQGRTQLLAQTGLLYVIKKRHQLDIRLGVGLNEASPNVLLGFGYAFRVDNLFGRKLK
jgi:Putative MetA-pathway of phenol degradation